MRKLALLLVLVFGFNVPILAYDYIGIDYNFDQLKAECDKNKVFGCLALGYMYTEGINVIQNNFKAVEYYQKACGLNHKTSCHFLGDMYKEGKGVRQNNSKAMQFYHKSCDIGYGYACYSLGNMHYNSAATEADYFKAAQYWQKGCNKDNYSACYNLGLVHYNGTGVKQDNLKAALYYQKARDLIQSDSYSDLDESIKSIDGLEKTYQYSKKIKRSKEQALEYYGKACDLQIRWGCKHYAKLKKASK